MPHRLVGQLAFALFAAGAGHACAQAPAAALVEVIGDSLMFDGQINARSAAEFLRLLRDPGVKRLVITSRGGSVAAALDMALAIHERGLDVEVPSACFSSCANYIFPAGLHKTLGGPGVVAWHGNIAHVLYLQQSGKASWTPEAIASARDLARREADFFRRIGVDGFVCWFAKIEPYNVQDFYYLSVDDMERFGIRGVMVREAPPGGSHAVEPRAVRVDWATFDAVRPAVRLDP